MSAHRNHNSKVSSLNCRPVILVGLMGAGKSAVGKALAIKLGWKFCDSDQEFEIASSSTINDYFARYGEADFRDGERKVIRRLLKTSAEEPMILATGGGAFCDAETRSLIQEMGTSVWLHAELDVLVSRTAGRNHRPLLQQGNPREILGDLLEKRYPLYRLADLMVESTHGSLRMTTSRVYQSLLDYWQDTNRKEDKSS